MLPPVLPDHYDLYALNLLTTLEVWLAVCAAADWIFYVSSRDSVNAGIAPSNRPLLAISAESSHSLLTSLARIR